MKHFVKTSFIPRDYSCEMTFADGGKISFLHESATQAGATSFINKLAKRVIGAKVVKTEAILILDEKPKEINVSFKNARIVTVTINS